MQLVASHFLFEDMLDNETFFLSSFLSVICTKNRYAFVNYSILVFLCINSTGLSIMIG